MGQATLNLGTTDRRNNCRNLVHLLQMYRVAIAMGNLIFPRFFRCAHGCVHRSVHRTSLHSASYVSPTEVAFSIRNAATYPHPDRIFIETSPLYLSQTHSTFVPDVVPLSTLQNTLQGDRLYRERRAKNRRLATKMKAASAPSI